MEHTLTPEEKRFILIVERGDTAGAAQAGRISVPVHSDGLGGGNAHRTGSSAAL